MQKSIPFTSIIIDPANDLQVHHWAKEMQVAPSDLKQAVRVVGRRVSDLRRHFGKSAEIINIHTRLAESSTQPTTWSAFIPVA